MTTTTTKTKSTLRASCNGWGGYVYTDKGHVMFKSDTGVPFEVKTKDDEYGLADNLVLLLSSL